MYFKISRYTYVYINIHRCIYLYILIKYAYILIYLDISIMHKIIFYACFIHVLCINSIIQIKLFVNKLLSACKLRIFSHSVRKYDRGKKQAVFAAPHKAAVVFLGYGAYTHNPKSMTGKIVFGSL